MCWSHYSGRQDFPGDASLVITKVQLNDTGYYRCEVVDGLEDKSTTLNLELHGEECPVTLLFSLPLHLAVSDGTIK